MQLLLADSCLGSTVSSSFAVATPTPVASSAVDARAVSAEAALRPPFLSRLPRAGAPRRVVAEFERVGLADHALVDRLHALAAVGLVVDPDRQHRIERDGGPHGDGEDHGQVLEAREQDLVRARATERSVLRRLGRLGDAERRAQEEERRREREEERQLLREVAGVERCR